MEEKNETVEQKQEVQSKEKKSKKLPIIIITLVIVAIIAIVVVMMQKYNGAIPVFGSNEKVLEMNQTTNMENICEIKITSNKVIKTIEPPSATGYYHYFKADDGKMYLDVIADVKNLAQSTVKQNSMFSAKVLANGAEYQSSLIIEKDNGSDLNGYTNLYNIEALETLKYHIATQLPESEVIAGKTLTLVLTVSEKEYVYKITIIDDANNQDKNTSVINLGAQAKKIAVGEKITVENVCELTVVKANMTSQIDPPSATGYYHYFKADDGKIYFDLVADIKNLKSDAVKQNSVIGKVKLVYDKNYEYDCSFIVEKDNGQDLNGYTSIYNINPLETMRYHIAVQVPKEVQDSGKSIELKFTIAGEDYIFQAR